jgi:hypothetical protein
VLKAEYIAGFFDGEGCVGIYFNGSKNPHLKAQITQNDSPECRELLADIIQQFGGALSGKKALHWQLHGAQCVSFLTAIEPHLRLKRIQVQICLAWQSQRPAGTRDPATGRNLPYAGDVDFDRKIMSLVADLKNETHRGRDDGAGGLSGRRGRTRQVICVKG